ncbi:MAG: sugar ABC transporter permease [Nitrososphaeria archaeon]|jgi:multiple sugar transport system permease protein
MVKLTIYHVFVFVAIGYILVISIFPMLYMVYGTFTNWVLGVKAMPFIGTAAYVKAVGDYRLYNSLTVTAEILIICVPSEIVLGIVLAQLMRANIRFKAIFRTLFLIPLFVAPVAVALMGDVLFYQPGGVVNAVLNIIKIPAVPWRTSIVQAPFTVAICDIWLWTPFCFLITLAALEGIPRELTEASVVDGASSFQIFRSINLPMIVSPLITISMFRVIDTLRMLDIPFVLMGQGGPGISTETVSVYIYKAAFRSFTLGYAGALSLIFMLMVIIIASIFLGRMRKYYA